MELNDLFISLARDTASRCGAQQPAIKNMVSHKHKKDGGTCAVLKFKEYKINVYFIESGIRRYYDRTFFATVSFERCEWLPFTLYDVLSFVMPENFKPYVFTELNTPEKLTEAWTIFGELFSELVPKLNEITEDGTQINRLILEQKETLGTYVGQPLDSLDGSIPSVAKLVTMLLSQYIDDTNEDSLFGTLSLFYTGKKDKALKYLKRVRKKTKYQKNLIAYIEAGGSEQAVTSAVSSSELAPRKAAVFIASTLVFAVLFAACCAGICYLLRPLFFKDALLILGFKESLVTLPVFTCIPAGTAAYAVCRAYGKKQLLKKNEKPKPESKNAKAVFKAFTIISETLIIVGCIVSMYSQCVFYKDKIAYNDSFFPINHYTVEYSAVDSAVLEKGYKTENGYSDDPHIELVLKSGATADLYNATFYSYGEFKDAAGEILTDKNIEIK